MDKYELSIKQDKIRKHAENKDYEMAVKIANTIDWKRVKNIKMLTLVSQIYEKVGDYERAKNVLLVAYEHVPVGRRMLYKLSELCVKSGDIEGAEEFFEEFQEIAPNDLSKLILAYQIGQARGESIDKLIMILEMYRKNEFEEKWAYELAELYDKADRGEDCVRLCNEIILWFSVGPYVEKAMELKMKYQPLSPNEKEKYVNKAKFEERIRAVEREFAEKYEQEAAEEEIQLSQSAPVVSEIFTKPAEEVAASPEEPEEIAEEVAEEELAEEEAPAEVVSAVEAPAEEMPVLEAPVEEVTAFEAPAEEAPAEEAPAEEMPAVEAPSEEPVVRETVTAADGLSLSSEFMVNNAEAFNTADFVKNVKAALESGRLDENKNRIDLLEEEDMSRMQDALETNIGDTKDFLDEVTAALAASASEMKEELDTAPVVDEPTAEVPVLQMPEEEAPAKEVPVEDTPAEETPVEEATEEEAPAEETPVAEMPAEELPEEETVESEVAAEEAPVEEEASVFKLPDETPAFTAEEEPAPMLETPEIEPEIDFPDPEIFIPDMEETPAENPFHITCVVIEEPDNEQRISIAVEKLKRTHEILEMPVSTVAKISGSKLNTKGVDATFEKLEGKDLIIDYAADLSHESAERLAAQIENPSSNMVVLLVDTAEKCNEFLLSNPALDQHCLYLEDDNTSYDDIPVAEAIKEVKEEVPGEEDDRMSAEAFAEMLMGFAKEEECVLDEGGKEAMLALAERMRNAGSSLDELTARNLLDEAIEKAEHRGFRGLFTTKYDKNGFLILKADCFKDL